MPRAVALIPARNEGGRIGPTVTAILKLAVDEVLVIDDGSTDGTAPEALAAGARVLTSPRDEGKGAALEAGLRLLRPADVYLLADGDLAESAGALGPVLATVLEGEADLAIAALPRPLSGGFGLVKQGAAWAIRLLCGFEASEPLSGQRAVTGKALEAARPLAGGFGVETAMTIDVVRGGFRVVEIAAALSHRPTGRDPGGFLHRGRQGWHILRVVLPRLRRRP